jgi:hypothetical protein
MVAEEERFGWNPLTSFERYSNVILCDFIKTISLQREIRKRAALYDPRMIANEM